MLDIIILSKTSNQAYFSMVKRCVDSYLASGDALIQSIIIVESDKHFDNSVWTKVSPKIKTIVPPYKFNYNQFLNIALEQCTAEVVCISNNDVEAIGNCVTAMQEFFDKIPALMSASPVDRTWHQNSYEIFPEDGKAYMGYETTKYLLGFCVFVRRSAFDIIGKFDERFHFYHQDNDLEMCLRRHALPHAMITLCHIKHGHDKPESHEDATATRAKLIKSQGVYYDKWRNPPYANAFKKYRKLSIVGCNNTTPLDEYVEVVDDQEQAVGQYVLITDRHIDHEEQQHLIAILNYKPTQVIINNLIINKKF